MYNLRIALLSFIFTFLISTGLFAYIVHNNNITYKNTNSFVEVDSLATQNKEILNDQIYNSRHSIITTTVKNISPAVVGINVTEIRQYRDPFANDPMFRYFFGDRTYNRKIQGLGSGFIISPDGYIVTNDHVAGNGAEIIVTMTNGKQYNARIIGTDPGSDICLLKIDENNLPYIKFGNSDDIMIGEWAIALGNPFGLFDINDKPTVTVGVISATGMNLSSVENRYYTNMIQTDAAINGGNSGGPLVNSIGELIGMNTLIYTPGGTGGSVGVGFAIPVNKIKKIVNIIKESGVVDRDFWTGLKIQIIDNDIAKYYNLANTRGVIVTYVAKGSPAYKAGIVVGDIIISIDNYRINDDNTLISVLYEFKTDDTVTLKLMRNNEEINKLMKLEKKK